MCWGGLCHRPRFTFIFLLFWEDSSVSVTETSSEKYLLAPRLCLTHGFIFKLPDDFSSSRQVGGHYGKRPARFPTCSWPRLCLPAPQKLERTNKALAWAHTARRNNQQPGSGQAAAPPPSPPIRSLPKVSAIIITVCAHSGCVLSYSLSQSSEETREFGRVRPRTGPSKYTVSTFLRSRYVFVGAEQTPPEQWLLLCFANVICGQ